jgi:hypothetical protein
LIRQHTSLFFQLDCRLAEVVDLQLASAIPMIKET